MQLPSTAENSVSDTSMAVICGLAISYRRASLGIALILAPADMPCSAWRSRSSMEKRGSDARRSLPKQLCSLCLPRVAWRPVVAKKVRTSNAMSMPHRIEGAIGGRRCSRFNPGYRQASFPPRDRPERLWRPARTPRYRRCGGTPRSVGSSPLADSASGWPFSRIHWNSAGWWRRACSGPRRSETSARAARRGRC